MIEPWTREQFESQLAIFPEGQLGVEIDGVLVATSSALIVDEEDFGAYHTFDEVSDSGFIRNHDPEGDTLYGIDIAVDPTHRGERLDAPHLRGAQGAGASSATCARS